MKHNNCKKCPESSRGKPDNASDICDSCQSDPDTGWGGYTDHSTSVVIRTVRQDKHYNG